VCAKVSELFFPQKRGRGGNEGVFFFSGSIARRMRKKKKGFTKMLMKLGKNCCRL
jgi:hypothetical protein